MNKLKSYTLNAAIVAAGGAIAGLAIGALLELEDTAGRIIGAILALGVMALIAKLPTPGNGRHRGAN